MKSVREFLDELHNALLRSYTRGRTETSEDETDHWGRDVTDADVAAITERTATIAASLSKE